LWIEPKQVLGREALLFVEDRVLIPPGEKAGKAGCRESTTRR
jgi:hypothetical protein